MRRLLLGLILCAVTLPAQSIRSVPDSLTLQVGDTVRLRPVVRDGAGAPIVSASLTFSGTNATAFSVARDGLLTARAPGCGLVRTSYAPQTTHVRAQVPVCVIAPATTPPVVTPPVTPPAAPSMFHNSAEAICAPSNPDILFCDDFEDGDWYSLHCDDANRTGGLQQVDGWCGTIYANPITPATAAVCGARGAMGTSCAATTGPKTGSVGGRNMATHAFAGGPVTELWARWYYKVDAGYQWGAEKHVNFTKAAGDIAWFNLQFNCGAGAPSATAAVSVQIIHGTDICQRPNVSAITLESGRWYRFEVHARLNSAGTTADGLIEVSIDDCGAGGVCNGPPTLRTRMANVAFNRNQTGCTTAPCRVEVLWFENWANPPSTGTAYYDQVVVSRAPLGAR